tara:strand:+ start:592 stop:1197 length:606 start_codon:yes stop_codon:yes gene_type:complete
MALDYRGAEAIVTEISWADKPAISKFRNPRGYRHPELDKKLIRERLRNEARLLEKSAEAGLPVPSLYSVNLDGTIIMEKIQGPSLEEYLKNNNDLSKISDLGLLLSNIHASGIVHGDPTSSNFIVGSELYAIDFGLGSVDDSNEARATDIRVLLESLEGHHSDLNCRDVLLDAYSKWNNSAPVLERLKVIELRGRYNLMRG